MRKRTAYLLEGVVITAMVGALLRTAQLVPYISIGVMLVVVLGIVASAVWATFYLANQVSNGENDRRKQ